MSNIENKTQEDAIEQKPGQCPNCRSTKYIGEPFVDTTCLHDGKVVEVYTCADCKAFWVEVYDCKFGRKYEIS